MKVNWKRYGALFGFILCLLGMGLMIFWNTVGAKAILYKNCIGFKTEVKKGDLIKEDMIIDMKVSPESLIGDTLYYTNDNIDSVIGMVAKQYIPKNSQVCMKFFENVGTALGKDEFVFRVPTDWILALPSSIRRSDIAYFYAVESDDNDISNNKSNVIVNQQQNNTESQGNGEPVKVIEQNPVVPYVDIEKYITNTDGTLKEPDLLATVEYVKDNANREVVSLGEYERYDGSSQVSSIEIKTTITQLAMFKGIVERGYKFVILYREGE